MWTSGKHLIIPPLTGRVKPFRAFSLRGWHATPGGGARGLREELDPLEPDGMAAVDPEAIIEIVRRLARARTGSPRAGAGQRECRCHRPGAWRRADRPPKRRRIRAGLAGVSDRPDPACAVGAAPSSGCRVPSAGSRPVHSRRSCPRRRRGRQRQGRSARWRHGSTGRPGDAVRTASPCHGRLRHSGTRCFAKRGRR